MYNYRNFKFTGNCEIKKVTEVYYPTMSGNWKSKPESIDTEIVSVEHYTNYVTSIPFFNNFEHGAYCRGHWNYTKMGYLPTKVVTVSPYKEKKIVTHFYFE